MRRRRIAEAVARVRWAALARAGVSEERWDSWPRSVRRAVRATFWVAVGLVLVALFGVWKTSALAVAAVILLLVVPSWSGLRVGRLALGKWVAPAVVLGLAIAYPYFVGSLPQLPIFGPFPQVSTMVVMAIFTMMALGLNFVVGYAGLLDLGYVAFYAMGAYMAGWFASDQFASRRVNVGAVGLAEGWTGLHFSIWLVLAMAGVATAIIGVIIGLPTLRLRGDYLAIVTLGFGEIMPQVARNGDHFFGFNLTNGTGGITPIDGPGFGTWAHEHLHLPANYLTAGNLDSVFFWTALVLVLVTVFCSMRLRDSRLGRAWVAIREDEVAAAAMGVPLMRVKTWSYATGAFFGGVAGAYYASYRSGTFPDDFFFNISVFILCMVILGGMGNIWGVIFGACFLSYLDREGLANVGAWINGHFGTNLNVPLYEFGIYGVIIVVVMLFRPEGLIPSARQAAEFHEGVHDEPLYDVARGAGVTEQGAT
ncbi:MAG: branched-chain amino acid ABC transporter permease [Thermoleophilia bacterium]|nr:branched-chain amino acid ABC transporter permease [Thermoleophilia bacterium]